MPYQPNYRYLPPLEYDWLTSWYDVTCTLVGLGRKFKEQVLYAIEVHDGEVIIDIGCATGVFMALAKQKYPRSRVIGVDPDARALAIARKRLAQSDLEVELHQAFAESLPLFDASVDACFSSLAFHHMPDDVKRKALEEMKRVLKSGGRIVIADFGPAKGKWLRRLLFFEKIEYLKGNLEGVVPRYVNELGFKKCIVVGRKFPGIVIFTAKKV